MDAVTYPDDRVKEFITASFVPLLLAHDAKPESVDFNIKWTPALITLGADSREHHRTVGFLDPENFIAHSILGIGKYHFDNDRYPEALDSFNTIIDEYSDTGAVPEALFLQGVSRYKNTGDPAPLKETYERLNKNFPDSEWARRASPYRLL